MQCALYYIIKSALLMMAFLTIFGRFRPLSEDFPELARRTFTNISRKIPRKSKDFWRVPKTFEEEQKMFRLCTNEFKYNLTNLISVSFFDASQQVNKTVKTLSMVRFFYFTRILRFFTTDTFQSKCKRKKHVSPNPQLGAIFSLSLQLYIFFFVICLHTNLRTEGFYFEKKENDDYN